MRTVMKGFVLAAAFALLLVAELSPGPLPGAVFLKEAVAVVGRPATPVSDAGLARRTTRRAVILTSD